MHILSGAVSVHKFLELGGLFDLEKDFLSVLRLDLQVQVLVRSLLGHLLN